MYSTAHSLSMFLSMFLSLIITQHLIRFWLLFFCNYTYSKRNKNIQSTESTKCLLGSKMDHLSHCIFVIIGPSQRCHHFNFHYNFIIWTPWVRGSLKRLSHPSHRTWCQTPVCWTVLWYIPPVSFLHWVTLLKSCQGHYDKALCLSHSGGKYFTS